MDDDSIKLARAILPSAACVISETDHYASTEAALAHFQGDWAAVKAKLAAGEIVIGAPELGPGEELVWLNGRKRYGILRWCRRRQDLK